ncbi:MAG: tripartite tricarboxylate transporter substrate-binding protein [Rhodoferax sp.]
MKEHDPIATRRARTLSRRDLLQRGGAVWAMLAVSQAAFASDRYPSRPIRLIASATPGGGIDILARLIAPSLSQRLGQPVVVDNKAGGNGIIGGQYVANAAPDGYTLLVAFDGTMSIMPALGMKMNFDPFTEVVAVTKLADAQALLAVHPSVQARNFRELKELSAKRPLGLGFAGAGSRAHLIGELLKSMGFNVVPVPYKGGGPAMQDAVGGQVQMVITSIAAAKPLIASGKLNGFAVTGTSRSPQLQEVPTFTEAGLDGFNDNGWYALYATKGTPQDVVNYVRQQVVAVIAEPQIRSRMLELGLLPAGGTPQELTNEMTTGRDKWGAVARKADVHIE